MAQGIEPRRLGGAGHDVEARRSRAQREMILAGVTMLVAAAVIAQSLKFREPGVLLIVGAGALSWSVALFLIGLTRWLRG